MTKLVDYFPFVRQQQLAFGIDPRVDKEFLGVQQDLKNIVEKTMMAEQGVIDAFDIACLENLQ